jgi:hypothetical protein
MDLAMGMPPDAESRKRLAPGSPEEHEGGNKQQKGHKDSNMREAGAEGAGMFGMDPVLAAAVAQHPGAAAHVHSNLLHWSMLSRILSQHQHQAMAGGAAPVLPQLNMGSEQQAMVGSHAMPAAYLSHLASESVDKSGSTSPSQIATSSAAAGGSAGIGGGGAAASAAAAAASAQMDAAAQALSQASGAAGGNPYENLAALSRIADIATLVQQHHAHQQQQQDQMRALHLLRLLPPNVLASLASAPPGAVPPMQLPVLLREQQAEGAAARDSQHPRPQGGGGAAQDAPAQNEAT